MLKNFSSKVWHIEFCFHSELSSTAFAKHYGTKVLTDCKCFCGKLFHGSHQLDSAGLLFFFFQENLGRSGKHQNLRVGHHCKKLSINVFSVFVKVQGAQKEQVK